MTISSLLLSILLALSPPASDYEKDVAFALETLEKKCGHFFQLKRIDWKAVAREFKKEAKSVKDVEDHFRLLIRLLARLKDGHAEVRPLDKAKGVRPPEEFRERRESPGMFWCRIGKDTFVKTVFGSAASSNVKPGQKILKVDGKPTDRWVEERVAELSDLRSFSTDQQALFAALHWGLSDAPGKRMKLDLEGVDGKKTSRTVACDRGGPAIFGPAFPPAGLVTGGDLSHAKTKSGFGYVHLRRCPGDLPERMDEILEALGEVPGLILDFRGNGGGGFDHDALVGRFVPEGKSMSFGKTYRSAGPRPYGGPVVVIVNATVVSAGETASGSFKEDGRAYMIGESPTAGMSSSKETIELPSGLFALYVSVASNKGRFNDGRGIEGIGVVPHEIVEFDPRDLDAGRDTLIERAEAILRDFPAAIVPYEPKAFGWDG